MHRASTFTASACALFLLVLAPVSVQADSTIRLAPSPSALRIAALREPIDAEAFLDAALALSGGTAGDEETARASMIAFKEASLGKIPDHLEAYARAEALLELLHGSLLERYEVTQTRVDAAILTGTYNCVSSALLYAYMAKKAGIPVAGVRTQDHAFCVVRLQEGDIDVETTNRFGFNPGSRKEFQDSFGRVTGYAYVPPSRGSARRVMGDREFLSLILSNRIAEEERAGLRADAVGLAADYDAILGTEESRSFLLDRVSNYAVSLQAKKDWDGALAFLSEAQAALGPSARITELSVVTALLSLSSFSQRGDWEGGVRWACSLPPEITSDPRVGEFFHAAVNNRVMELVSAKRFEEARSYIDGSAHLIPGGKAAELRRTVDQGVLAEAVRKGPFPTALSAVEDARAAGVIDRDRYTELVEYLFGTQANEVARRAGWLAGISVLEDGLNRIPGSARLASALRGFRSNWTAQMHNRFADLFNARKYEEAGRLLSECLKEDPKNRTFLEDQKTMESAR
jgi:hypothetical protein